MPNVLGRSDVTSLLLSATAQVDQGQALQVLGPKFQGI